MAAAPKLTIRERSASDIPALADVIAAVYAVDGYPVEGPFATAAEWGAFLAPATGTTAAWVAEVDGAVAGHVAVMRMDASSNAWSLERWAAAGHTPANTALLGRMFVDPKARRKGLARRLVLAVMQWAAAAEPQIRLGLYVVTKDLAAIALYDDLGWKRIGETYDTCHSGVWNTWMYALPVQSKAVDAKDADAEVGSSRRADRIDDAAGG